MTRGKILGALIVLWNVMLLVLVSTVLWHTRKTYRRLTELQGKTSELEVAAIEESKRVRGSIAELVRTQQVMEQTVKSLQQTLQKAAPPTLNKLAVEGVDFLAKRIVPDDPDLQRAMERDPYFNPAGSREEAVTFYEAFIKKNPSNPYVYRVLLQVAGLYSMWASSEQRDDTKAKEYYMRALEAAGSLLNKSVIVARVNAGACIEDRREQLRAHARDYKWLLALTAEDIKKRWGVTSVTAGKGVSDEDIRVAMRLNKELTDTLAKNIICLLYTSPSPRDRTRSRMPSSA